MKTTELLEVERALHSIGLTLKACYQDRDRGPCSVRSGSGALTTQPKAGSHAEVAQRSTAVQERAAIHYCLTSASVLLDATRHLMTEPSALSPQDRAQRRRSLIDDMEIAAHSAYRAGSVLAGHDPCTA